MDDNTKRELKKIRLTLEWCNRHFEAEAQMNAAKHKSETVLPNPLAADVSLALVNLDRLMMEPTDGA